MNNKWLVVFGANSDMAVAIARRFAEAGWCLHLASRDTAALEREANHIALRFGVEAKGHHFDALDFNSHENFYKGLNPAPDGAIAAFGTMQGDIPTLAATNYTGAANILEIVANEFEVRKQGFIVGISSVAGDRGRQSNYIYGSAKAGLTAYLSGLRQRLYASGISVLTVKPGFTATKMTAGMDLPARLTTTPDKIAEAVYRAVIKRKDVIYLKRIWRWIMFTIIHIPVVVFKRMKL
jgi:short-subunit dehydrogenase